MAWYLGRRTSYRWRQVLAATQISRKPNSTYLHTRRAPQAPLLLSVTEKNRTQKLIIVRVVMVMLNVVFNMAACSSFSTPKGRLPRLYTRLHTTHEKATTLPDVPVY